MLLDVLIAAEDLGRLHEMARILVKFGFTDLVQRMGLLGFLQRAGKLLRIDTGQGPAEPMERRARLALEELGPTFVKLGQLLASRSDLLPSEWVDEFSQLQFQVKKVAWEELREQLIEDLGKPPEEVFSDLQTEPLAAGSIGQVHCAKLRPQGNQAGAQGQVAQEVVLKVRRPGIKAIVLADLRLLERLTDLLEQEVPEFRRYRPKALIRQFGRSIRTELDLALEARNTKLARENMREFEQLVVPRVYDEYSGPRLVVLERLHGTPAVEWLRQGRQQDFDGPRLATIGAESVLHMVFLDRFFHADPHPGNLLFMPDGRVGLLDFGMMGRLSESRREEFAGLLSAVIGHDEDGMVDTLLEWTDGGATDVEQLTQDCSDFLDRHASQELRHLEVSAVLSDIRQIVRENHLVLPGDVALLIKVFLTLEGLGRALDPQFSLDKHIAPLARKMMMQIRSPKKMAIRNWRQVQRLLSSLPRDTRKLIQRMRRGGFKIDLDLQRLEEFGRQLDRSANRVTMGLITSALIVGTSIAMTIDGGPKLFGIPILGLAGFVTSFLIGMMLLWSILRSGNR